MARAVSKREKILLTGLAVAVVAYAWYSVKQDETQPFSETAAAAKAQDIGQAPVVRMDLLESHVESYDARGRDLFQYTERPKTAAELAAIAQAERERIRLERLAAQAALEQAERDRLERERQAQIAANAPPQPPPRPVPPPVTFQYIGYLGHKDDRIAVFLNGKDEILAKKGEVVLDQFRVVDIGYETAVIGFTNPQFRGETREVAMVRK